MLAFSALSDPTRLRIVEMLTNRGELSATRIGSHFSMSPPAISQHLRVLREAGLVRVEARAQQRIYTIDPAGMTEMEQWIGHMRRIWDQRLGALGAFLTEEVRKTRKPAGRKKHARKRPP